MAPLIDSSLSRSSESDDEDDITVVTTPLHPIHPSPSPKTNKKSVSFHPIVAVKPTLNRKDYTPEENIAAFFDDKEMEAMKTTVRYQGYLLEKSLLEPSVPSRGLEHVTRKGCQRKKKSRTNAYMAVFFEFDIQVDSGVDWYDDDAIADAYYECSRPCAERAVKMGKLDALQAAMIYNADKADICSLFE